jgi:choline/glycine/proline betaine transport protein
MLSMGDDHPPRRFRVVWGVSIGVVAALLLLVDGLQALQAASIAAALPVSLVMLAMTFGVIKSLAEDSSAVPAAPSPEASG